MVGQAGGHESIEMRGKVAMGVVGKHRRAARAPSLSTLGRASWRKNT